MLKITGGYDINIDLTTYLATYSFAGVNVISRLWSEHRAPYLLHCNSRIRKHELATLDYELDSYYYHGA